MNIPENLKYAKTHEWVRDAGGGVFEIGISDYAQSELGDIVFVNLPEVGDAIKAGASLADIESVKAVSDIFSPVTGKVIAVNAEVTAHPEIINGDPYGSWLVRIEGVIAENLLSAAEYAEIAG